jgi:molecular chaperone DnaK
MSYVNFGIDLGTTNSCVASADGAEVRVYPNNDQMSVTPSVVRILKTGRLVVGKRAYNAISEDPDNIALEFKRWMGQKHERAFPAAGRTLTAEDLSAEVLKSLAEDVKRQTGAALQASVVTVPAAFGALQCDATARAAHLAGFEQAPLLQEPIAAAIAYGADPKGKNQRWMVFDLGGGTLDIAVVSTKDGRLNVLEHRGNNLLGGKDVDRKIVEAVLLPILGDSFALPDPAKDPAGQQRLFRRLAIRAEEAKIDLSTSESVVISLVDIGEDANGKPIEAEIPFSRAQLESLLEPMLEKCLRLAHEALEGARLGDGELDRILLVGGPTQTPVVRKALAASVCPRVDFSLDPMTVVARGAALYAATIEREQPKGAAAAAQQPASPAGALALTLAFEPVSATLTAPVAGKFPPGSAITEIKIDAEGGWWTSGWSPVKDGTFELPVTLQEGKQGRFWIYAREANGRLRDVDPGEIRIRHGLVVSAPPLPHSIGIELAKAGGKPELDPVFKRGTPLPAERTVRYRADRTLRPIAKDAKQEGPKESIAIKLWEGEELADSEANEWVGNIHIGADELRRSLPEGSEIELHIGIDASRLISVEAFVPHLNQHFSQKLYVAQQEEQDFADLSKAVPSQIAAFKERLEELEDKDENGKPREDVQRLKEQIDEIERETSSKTALQGSQDPDQAKRFVEASRDIRSRIVKLEKSSGVDREIQEAVAMAAAAESSAAEIVNQFGSPLEKKEMELLKKQSEKAIQKADEKALRRVAESYESLRWRVLFKQDWYWREVLKALSEPGKPFVSKDEADRWLAKGQDAVKRGDSQALQEAVRALWKLQPKSEAEADQEKALRSGLRRF